MIHFRLKGLGLSQTLTFLTNLFWPQSAKVYEAGQGELTKKGVNCSFRLCCSQGSSWYHVQLLPSIRFTHQICFKSITIFCSVQFFSWKSFICIVSSHEISSHLMYSHQKIFKLATFLSGVVILTQCFAFLQLFPIILCLTQNMRLYLHMRLTTKVFTSLMKLPTTNAQGDADPSLQMQAHLTRTAAVKQSTFGSVAWGRTSTWSWGMPRKVWLHLASLSKSWERTTPRAWGPTIRRTSAFTRGHWGQGSTPLWRYPHAWGWWVKTKIGCRKGSNEMERRSK